MAVALRHRGVRDQTKFLLLARRGGFPSEPSSHHRRRASAESSSLCTNAFMDRHAKEKCNQTPTAVSLLPVICPRSRRQREPQKHGQMLGSILVPHHAVRLANPSGSGRPRLSSFALQPQLLDERHRQGEHGVDGNEAVVPFPVDPVVASLSNMCFFFFKREGGRKKSDTHTHARVLSGQRSG